MRSSIPIDQSRVLDRLSLKELTLSQLPVILHVLSGTVALFAGVIAMVSRKGGRRHEKAGTIFFVCMLVMGGFADYLAVTVPDIPNLFVGSFTIYLVMTGWMAARLKNRQVGVPEKIALAAALCLFLPFAVLSFQLIAGLQTAFKSTVPFEGPVRIAIYIFTFSLAVAAAGDARLLLQHGITRRRRVGRHLWRMCLAVALAAGSAFTNGLPRLLPHALHIPLILLFLPQLCLFASLVFWVFRVRFTVRYEASPSQVQPVG
jgi:uncharacterized membrane protein